MFILRFVATIALGTFLPNPTAVRGEVIKRQKFGIFLFVFAAVVFRAEVALFLATHLVQLLIIPRINLQQMVSAGLYGAVLALGISIPIESFFWQKPIWPELWGFYFNAIQGKSAEWGTSPYGYYFTSLLPRLLLNPCILILLIPLSMFLPAIQRKCSVLLIPSILFIAIYSLQPHKEARFIIYAVPPLTAAASLSASYIWNHRTKSLLFRLGSLLIILSIIGSFVGSTLMLLISSLNYPGGEALTSVKHIIKENHFQGSNTHWEPIYVHMDVLSCMTGVTRFQERSGPLVDSETIPKVRSVPSSIVFDKEENESRLLEPAFWEQLDYALMEAPGKAIGKWEVVDTIYAYAGLEFLRPGQGDPLVELMENFYAADNATKEESVVDSRDVKHAVAEGVDVESASGYQRVSAKAALAALKRILEAEYWSRYEIYRLVKEMVRLLTGGYWLGPKMAPTIRILKRVKDLST